MYVNFSEFNWDEKVSELSTLSSTAAVKQLASTFKIQSAMDRGDYVSALSSADQVLDRNPSDALWLSTSIQKVITLVAMGILPSANQIFNDMKDRGMAIDDVAVHQLEELLAIGPAAVSISGGQPGTNEEAIRSVREENMPTKFSLHQNFPNPFNPATKIEYALPVPSHVNLRVYNVLGQEVVTLLDEYQEAGYKAIHFDGGNLPSGVYLYRIRAGEFTGAKKLILIR